MLRHVVLVMLAASLAGCQLFGADAAAERLAAQREADGKAIGGACRHAGRAIEDCFMLNKRADRAAVYAGWREMNDYMRENKVEPVPPALAGQAPAVTDGGKPALERDARAKARS
jgi:hypothetical protein